MSNTGVYVLWLYLPQTMSIGIGKLGTFQFDRGVYAYAGSAQRNLQQRLARHRRLEKKLHWHIDYFRAKAHFLGAASFYDQPKSAECLLTQELLKIPGAFFPVPGFGASDCRCESHLVRVALAEPRLRINIS
jgi:Uri superfamily endonuclease